MPDYYPMENNTQNSPQPTPPRRKQMAPRDMLLIALAVLVLVRVDWRHMNSFHYPAGSLLYAALVKHA